MCRILTVVFNHSIFFRGKVFAPILTPRFPANSSVDYFKITKIILNMFELHSLTLKKLDFSASNKELLRLFYLFNKLFCTWLFLFSQINWHVSLIIRWYVCVVEIISLRSVNSFFFKNQFRLMWKHFLRCCVEVSIS